MLDDGVRIYLLPRSLHCICSRVMQPCGRGVVDSTCKLIHACNIWLCKYARNFLDHKFDQVYLIWILDFLSCHKYPNRIALVIYRLGRRWYLHHFDGNYLLIALNLALVTKPMDQQTWQHGGDAFDLTDRVKMTRTSLVVDRFDRWLISWLIEFLSLVFA